MHGSPKGGFWLPDSDAVAEFAGAVYAAYCDKDVSGEGRAVLVRRNSAGGWETLVQQPTRPDAAQAGAASGRVPSRPCFRRFAVGRLPGRTRSLCIAMVTAGRSEIVEIKEDGTLLRSPNPNLGADLPPVGQLEFLGARVFAVPAAPDAVSDAAEGRARILVAGKRGLGDWHDAGEPGFGDPRNQFVSAMAAFGDHLYVAAANPISGFELWRTEATGDPPFRWSKVLAEGAYRFAFNATVTAMMADGDYLYLATASAVPKSVAVGDRGPELLRVDAGGSWDIVVGTARFTPDGLKRPLSRLAAGFGSTEHSAITRLHRLQGMSVARLNPYVAGEGGRVGGYGGAGTAWTSRDWIKWRLLPRPS